MLFRDLTPPKNPKNGNISLKRNPVRNSKKNPASYLNKTSADRNKIAIISKSGDSKKEKFFLAATRESRVLSELIYIFVFAGIILFSINFINLAATGLKFKKSFIEAAQAGFDKIVSGAVSLKDSNFSNANFLFNQAKTSFDNMQNEAWFISPNFPSLNLSDPTFSAASSVINAGKYLSQAGQTFATVIQALESMPQEFFDANSKELIIKPSLTEKLKSQISGIFSAADNLKKANESISGVASSFIPVSLKERFEFSKNALGALSNFINTLEKDIPAILALLGDKEPQTFLVLMQNNAELRPTGGFIGNFMILETNDGYLSKSQVFDVYSADHKLKERIAPPPEIKPVNESWFLRDSNYSGHFPISAQKAAWFLEQEEGPGVDTVIAIDQSLIGDLIQLTGEISVPELPRPLNGGNFAKVLSYIIEAKISGRQQPKAIMESFVPAFEQALFKKAAPAEIIKLLQAAIEKKHVLAYSKNKEIQDFFVEKGLAGEMKELEPKEDYLNIVHTSIGGNKSDEYMSEEITHDTYLKSDGTMIDEVNISRSHGWTSETEKDLRSVISEFGFNDFSRPLLEILGRSRNIQALRIYVPAGSVLEESSDPGVAAKFDPETGKTYFSARMETGVGETRKLRIRYKLPFKLNLDPVDKYSVTFQKQAGQDDVLLTKRILPDSQIMNYKIFPETGSFGLDGVLSHETAFNKDLAFNSIWGK